MIYYNVLEEKGKKVLILKRRTAFKIVQDLLETDYLGSIINEAIEEDGKHDPSLVKGALVSDRKSLKKKLAREGIMVDLVMNRFLENEIPLEQYLFLQQYVGSVVLKLEGADNLGLKIKRGVNEEYFRRKGIKLANLNNNANWRLESITDIVSGKCTLGHDIRYAFTAVNNLGEKLVFGSTCVNDFFDIDEQLGVKLQDCVSRIKDITDEYYNDYHAYYEVHKNLDTFMNMLTMFIHKLTNGNLYNKQELGYLSKFVGYGLPVPRDLARQIGIKTQVFLNHEFNHIFFPKNLSSVRNMIYMLYCFSMGSHGCTKQDLRGFFPTNYLGDRIMPKEADQLNSLLSTDYALTGSNEFVNSMALNLTKEQFGVILSNLYQLKQLTKRLESDSQFDLKQENRGMLTIVHKGSGVRISNHNVAMELLFNIPPLDSIKSGFNYLMSNKLSLKYDLSKIDTVDLAFIGEVKGLSSEDRKSVV